MSLELVDFRGPSADRHLWIPFTSSEGYENPHWWNSAGGTIGPPWFVQVLEAGMEMADGGHAVAPDGGTTGLLPRRGQNLASNRLSVIDDANGRSSAGNKP
jgi:hypothetical protein